MTDCTSKKIKQKVKDHVREVLGSDEGSIGIVTEAAPVGTVVNGRFCSRWLDNAGWRDVPGIVKHEGR